MTTRDDDDIFSHGSEGDDLDFGPDLDPEHEGILGYEDEHQSGDHADFVDVPLDAEESEEEQRARPEDIEDTELYPEEGSSGNILRTVLYVFLGVLFASLIGLVAFYFLVLRHPAPAPRPVQAGQPAPHAAPQTQIRIKTQSLPTAPAATPAPAASVAAPSPQTKTNPDMLGASQQNAAPSITPTLGATSAAPTALPQPSQTVAADTMVAPANTPAQAVNSVTDKKLATLTGEMDKVTAALTSLSSQIESQTTAIAHQSTVLDSLGHQLASGENAGDQSKVNALSSQLKTTAKQMASLKAERNRLVASQRSLQARVHALDSQLIAAKRSAIFAGWTVVGMSSQALALRGPDGHVQVVRAGASFGGTTIKSIDANRGVVVTSLGTIHVAK